MASLFARLFIHLGWLEEPGAGWHLSHSIWHLHLVCLDVIVAWLLQHSWPSLGRYILRGRTASSLKAWGLQVLKCRFWYILLSNKSQVQTRFKGRRQNSLLDKWSAMQVTGQKAFMVAIFVDYQEIKLREKIIKKWLNWPRKKLFKCKCTYSSGFCE